MTVYTLFGQPASPASLTADATAYTLGVQFSVSAPATLTAIWFYSAPGAAALPGAITLYQVTGPTEIHTEAAAWSGAAGSGWVRAAFSSPPALTPGTAYKACVTQASLVNWYSTTANYFLSGPGQNGVTSGPLTAPNGASSAQGQDTFIQGAAVQYPNGASGDPNYWIDPEATAGTDQGGGSWPYFRIRGLEDLYERIGRP